MHPTPPTHSPARPTPAAVNDSSIRVNAESDPVEVQVSQFEPIMRTFRMLTIPILALDEWGNACPGTQPIPYTKQVGGVWWGWGARPEVREEGGGGGGCTGRLRVCMCIGGWTAVAPLPLGACRSRRPAGH